MRTNGLYAIALVIIIGLIFVWWGRSLTPSEPVATPSPAQPTPTSSPPSAASAEASEKRTSVDMEFEACAEKIAETLAIALHARQPTDAPQTAASDDDWPRDYARTDFALMEYFVAGMGRLDVPDLVRHEKLNPTDKPLSEKKIDDLRTLVELLNSNLEDLHAAYRSVRGSEMRAAIKAGEVEPEPDKLPAETTLRAMARSRLESGEYPGLSEDQILAKLKERRFRSVRANSVVHKGRVYRYASFTHLPRTDRAHEVMEFFAFDALGVVSTWFLSAGTITSNDQAAILASGGTSRLEAARAGPAFWER